ncbi:DNA glycosylase AlkZ-like family protein, partial [Kribbia dieselivorans]|uniref:DNA glycosylase AlkZ-like family protein n=1 Tax=Kribbia dieselivorans TaxID=331526 RepID=UPI000B339C72
VVLHSPYGSRVHAPWALCIAARLRARFGVEVQAMHGDDGIVLRLPNIEVDDVAGFDAELIELVVPPADDVAELVTTEVGGSAVFAARFRECAARALLLPRPNPTRRQPLWQQRQRASQLLQVAAQFPDFPITLEAVRECLQDVFDVPALVDLMRAVESRRIGVTAVETAQPSPFARNLLFGYVAEHLYDGDTPLAERRAAALSLDPALLDELLGRDQGLSLRDLLDPEQVARTENELQHLTEGRAARDAEDVLDLIRVLGPLPAAEVARRCVPEVAARVEGVLTDLVDRRLVIAVHVAEQEQYVVVEDASRVRDGLGAALPVGVAQVFLEPVADPMADLVARHARTHGPFTATMISGRFGLSVPVVQGVLARLVAAGTVTSGELIPLEAGGGRESEYCDLEVLRLLRRRSLAALRAEVEPVTTADYARFLPVWQHVGEPVRGSEGLLVVLEQFAGVVVPASALESLILPARVRGYSPGMLDEVLASGEVVWRGHGALAGDDGWISLHPTETAHLTLPRPTDLAELSELARQIWAAVPDDAAVFARSLAETVIDPDATAASAPSEAQVAEAIWELVWAGHLTADTLGPLRTRLAGSHTTHRRPTGPRSARLGRLGRVPLGGPGSVAAAARAARVASQGLREVSGRWSRLPEVETDPTVRAWAAAEVLLDRYGVLTRGPVTMEEVPGGFAAIHKVLTAAEEAGRVRRGYFIESLGGSQFGSTGSIDRLRSLSRLPAPEADRDPWQVGPAEVPTATVLAACDPANPYGAGLEWPDVAESVGHRPGRKAGALVALVDGSLVLFLERGGRTALTFTSDRAHLTAAATALTELVSAGRLSGLTIERIDGQGVLGAESALGGVLQEAGFHLTPRGLRLRG